MKIKKETFVFAFGFFSLVSILMASILVILFGTDESATTKGSSGVFSPRPGSPGSPVRIGYAPRFVSKQVLQSSASNITFNYVSNPLTDGTAGYLTYNSNSNMLMWPVKLPISFTHAKLADGKIFKFRRPGTSDTYGSFVDGSIPANFFMSSIELGFYS